MGSRGVCHGGASDGDESSGKLVGGVLEVVVSNVALHVHPKIA